jgi:ABC-type uncharacterized transport system ATPase subunit
VTSRPPFACRASASPSARWCANDDISLDLARGEVLALLGENGAGKSTLVSILFGHYVADAGHIEVEGRTLPPGQPRAALAAGIGMVHQHFTLADNLSVLDNVMLGTESLWLALLAPRRRAPAAAGRRCTLRPAGGPRRRVADLSVGERQRVEILKALVRGARILILDEPTAVLTPQESESLFATLAQMVAQGLSIIFISHKLDEVLRVSHRIAVLRAGRLVATLPAAGRRQGPAGRSHGRPQRGAGTSHGHGANRRSGVRAAPGPGRRPSAAAWIWSCAAARCWPWPASRATARPRWPRCLCGERGAGRRQSAGAGRALPARPRAFVNAGVARMPEDRHAVGVVGDLPLWENAMLERYHLPAFSRRGLAVGALRWRTPAAWSRASTCAAPKTAAWTRRHAACPAATCRSSSSAACWAMPKVRRR